MITNAEIDYPTEIQFRDGIGGVLVGEKVMP